MTRSFIPPAIIRNGHIQTTLTSLKPRKYLAHKRALELKKTEQPLILKCGNSVQLQGIFNNNPNKTKGLVTLIHGWEGSAESSYILSAATALFKEGFSVFRLNLRDHGNSHHLNQKPFNSSRLDEVFLAILEINKLCPHQNKFLAGFSLGGNFAIRIGVQRDTNELQLSKIVAVSPLINPLTTTESMEKKHKIYHHYFMKKWKKSLRKKMTCYPELGDQSLLSNLTTLRNMHDYFVPRHTKSKTTEAYFDTYKITAQLLQSLSVPTHIISSIDDPITRVSELEEIEQANIPDLKIHKVPYGGHCGFIQDLQLTSWIDDQLVTLFTKS